jgi:hypothetical protein
MERLNKKFQTLTMLVLEKKTLSDALKDTNGDFS